MQWCRLRAGRRAARSSRPPTVRTTLWWLPDSRGLAAGPRTRGVPDTGPPRPRVHRRAGINRGHRSRRGHNTAGWHAAGSRRDLRQLNRAPPPRRRGLHRYGGTLAARHRATRLRFFGPASPLVHRNRATAARSSVRRDRHRAPDIPHPSHVPPHTTELGIRLAVRSDFHLENPGNRFRSPAFERRCRRTPRPLELPPIRLCGVVGAHLVAAARHRPDHDV